MKHMTLMSGVLLSLIIHSALAAEPTDVTSLEAINNTEVHLKVEKEKAHGNFHRHHHKMPSKAERSDHRKINSKEYRRQRLQAMSYEERRGYRQKWEQKKTSHSNKHNFMKEINAIDAYQMDSYHPDIDSYFKDVKIEAADKKEAKLLFMQAHPDHRKAIRNAFLEMSPEGRAEARERWREKKKEQREHRLMKRSS